MVFSRLKEALGGGKPPTQTEKGNQERQFPWVTIKSSTLRRAEDGEIEEASIEAEIDFRSKPNIVIIPLPPEITDWKFFPSPFPRYEGTAIGFDPFVTREAKRNFEAEIIKRQFDQYGGIQVLRKPDLMVHLGGQILREQYGETMLLHLKKDHLDKDVTDVAEGEKFWENSGRGMFYETVTDPERTEWLIPGPQLLALFRPGVNLKISFI